MATTKTWRDRYAYFRSGPLLKFDVPVFHRSATWDERKEQDGIIVIPAVCGLALHAWRSDGAGRIYDPVLLQRKHARKFARPCKGCGDVDD